MPSSYPRLCTDLLSRTISTLSIGLASLLSTPRTSRKLTSAAARFARLTLGIAAVHSFALGAQLTLTWTDNSSDETGFKIERSADGTNFSQIATVGADVTSYLDAAVSSGTYSYRVRAYNATLDSDYTNVVSSFVAPVTIAPGFTTQPSSQTAIQGGTISFAVASSGTPAPTFQWYRNGVQINGANASTLTLSFLTTNDTGSYTVVATNSAGSTTSSSATLTVNQPAPTTVAPTFTSQPSAQAALAGATVAFSISVTGTPSPTLQWYKDGAAISGASSNILSLSSVTTGDSGTYKVIATNSAGSATSSAVSLVVTNPAPVTIAPSFTSQPTSRSVTPEAAVSFAVSATGTPSPTFQWYKNGAQINGANASTLSFSAVTTSDAGTYTVVATNSVTSVTSAGAILSVTPPAPSTPSTPEAPSTPLAPSTPSTPSTPSAPVILAPAFTSQPLGQSVTAGAPISLSVGVSGSPAPAVQWYKDGSQIGGAMGTTLSFGSISVSDAGTYTVIASNSAGSVVSSSATVAVVPATTPPVIVTQPNSQVVSPGTSASFSVIATGTPAPSYQWKKNGNTITGATSSTLSYPTISADNAGSYTVIISNSVGTVTSAPVTLTVSSAPSNATAPTITTQPTSQSVAPGATVSFVVGSSASPSPTYQWMKDGSPISGANSPVLTLSGVTAANAGGYSVVAVNSAGSTTSSTALLTVGGATVANVAPAFRMQPVSQSMTAGGNISFGVIVTGSPTPSIQWRKDGVAISGATSTNLVLARVSAANAGSYTAVATNSSGSVTSSAATLIVNTPSAASSVIPNPSTAPTRLVNASIRAIAGQGDQTLIVGFVTTQTSKSVLLRAIGPGLASLTSAQTFADPILTLYSGSTAVMSNDNWGGSSAMTSIFQQFGAFQLDPASRDSALLANLTPNAYTAQVTGTGTGMTLVEVYDGDVDASTGRIVNLAARAKVGSGDNVLIAGFVITGNTPKKVLVRAIGPALAALGVTGVLDAPQLDLYSGSTVIQHNEGWGGSAAMTAAFAQAGAFPLADPKSKDAAILMTLDPGAYTAIISGSGTNTGVALVEVYELP